jgi:uncharacterized coiled-coil protein SlyX
MYETPIDICACVGPLMGEPYCPCEMRQNGLESIANKWSQEDKDDLQKALEEIFDPKINNPQVTNRDRVPKMSVHEELKLEMIVEQQSKTIETLTALIVNLEKRIDQIENSLDVVSTAAKELKNYILTSRK